MTSRPRGQPPGFPATLRAAHAKPTQIVRPMLRPQAPLELAVRDASRQATPTGLGLDSQRVRARMVERLKRQGLDSEPLSQALRQVPRHDFVDTALANQAYEDTSLPIGHGQTISKPSVVARMLALLLEGARARSLGSLGRVLEIGTGCGYQAALLAQLSTQVVSIERIGALFERAAVNLAPWRGDRIRLIHGDGMRGHPPNAPYDSMIAAAGGDELPAAWLEQMAIGGRLIAPMRPPRHAGQVLVVVDRHEGGYRHVQLESVRFVPLKSGSV